MYRLKIEFILWGQLFLEAQSSGRKDNLSRIESTRSQAGARMRRGMQLTPYLFNVMTDKLDASS
jgi:hypothetical protein